MSSDSGIQWTSIDAPKSIPPRFRWIGWIIVLGIVGALITFALIEGDKIVRDIATGVVRGGLSTALELPEGTQMDVELGEGLLVFQAVTGKIDSVDVHIPGYVFGGATGTLDLTVTGVPLNTGKPVSGVQADVSFDEANMLLLGGYLSTAPINSVVLADQTVSIGADLAGNAVVVGLAPSTANNAVLFTPTTVTTGGVASTVDAVLAGPLAPLAAPLLTSQALCIGQYLPAKLAVTQVAVADKQLVITATGKDLALAALASKGNCEAPAA